ncbi:MAG: DUF2752 domain-containing protein [Muribaculaceae bacterium]|nr:DUF2752 domain-containing protein [Muribaculaceae bacterium]
MSTKRIVLWTIAGVLVLAGVAVYFFNDPSDPGASKYFPKCPVYSLTGLKCPGCGSQRVLHDLLNGDWSLAVEHNALLLLAIPVIGLYFVADALKRRYPALDNALNHPVAIIILVVIVTLWTVARNIWGW